MSGHDDVVPENLPNVTLPLQQDPALLFADESYLSYCVPSETDLDISKLLVSRSDGRDLLHSIEQRDTLFFGAWPLHIRLRDSCEN
jgi:hypothetical protein